MLKTQKTCNESQGRQKTSFFTTKPSNTKLYVARNYPIQYYTSALACAISSHPTNKLPAHNVYKAIAHTQTLWVSYSVSKDIAQSIKRYQEKMTYEG